MAHGTRNRAFSKDRARAGIPFIKFYQDFKLYRSAAAFRDIGPMRHEQSSDRRQLDVPCTKDGRKVVFGYGHLAGMLG
jgi:hypothetical protein